MNREETNTPESDRYIYVGESAALGSLIERLGTVERVALDTEADSLHSYFEKLCLLQLSLRDEHYLVDPLCGLELTALLEALADKPLIVHGGDYDLRMLRTSFGFTPRAEVFDTMIAAQLLGFEAIGLAALIDRFFGVTIGKEGQKSDWSRRPLSEKQRRYAINDTRYLAALAERLGGLLKERERIEWHNESCRAMVASSLRDRVRDAEEAWRIKGAGRLTRRQLAYLRALWQWRDRHARRANVPAFMIFGNQQIMDLVQWLDSHPGVPLRGGPRLPRNIRDALRYTLEDTIARVAAMEERQWPEIRRSERGAAPPAEFFTELDALRRECARIASALQIAPSILAPRAALETIVRSRPRAVAEIVERAGLLRWQAELVQPAVDKCLHASEEDSSARK